MTNRAPLALWLVAAALMGFALIISSQLLIELGPLRTSLTSENPSTRATAEMTVTAARVASALLGVAIAFACLGWRHIAQSRLVFRLVALRVPEAERVDQRRVLTTSGLVTVGLGLASLLYLFVIGQRLSPELRSLIGREDGLVEQGTALAFLAASIASFVAMRFQGVAAREGSRDQKAPRQWRKRWLGLFGVLFFLACGEEMSWGQRLFGFATPAELQSLNVQNETNLHNMMGYLADHLFIAGVFVFGVVLPLLASRYDAWRRALHRAGVPVASLGLALGFALASALHEWTVGALLAQPPLRIAELRELVVGVCFLALMFEQLRGARQRAAAAAVEGYPSEAAVPAE